MNIDNSSQTVKRLSALAQLIQMYYEKGITGSGTLAKATGFAERQIWRAKAELRAMGATPDVCVTPDACTPVTGDTPPDTYVTHTPDVCVSGKTLSPPLKKKGLPHTPSKEKTTPPLSGLLAAREDGVSDLGEKWVQLLAGWLGGELGVPNVSAAQAILAGTVEVYGPDQTRAGILELQTHLAAGHKFQNLPKAFASFVKNATTKPKLAVVTNAPRKPQTLWEILQAEEAAKASSGGVA